ncbi:MAG: DUF357 domain-containing protein [Candidatus Diapherotrites archaeon]
MSLEKELQKKTEKYRLLTEKALSLAMVSAEKNSKDFENAIDFLEMAKNYLSDGKYYEKKGDLLTALASYSYAHAWIDAGIRARILKGEGNRLFTQPK